MPNEITIGADIEFIARANTSHIPHTIEGMIRGSKHDPRPVLYGNVQEDNVLPEMAIDYVTTKEDFVRNILTVTDELQKILDEYNVTLFNDSFANFPANQLKSEQATTFGCDPDMNCWSGEINPPPKTTRRNRHLRTAGGHVHVGFDGGDDMSNAFKMAQWLEVFLGIPSVIKDVDGITRRQLYGKAGACRTKPYGVEYRVMSNWWANKDDAAWVFDQVHKAYESYKVGTVEQVYGNGVGDSIQKIINTGSKEEAEKACKSFGVAYA